uniref:Uncharacterized protein n=2 Tax=Dunaliella tertiolecta TaxID=3047 RepID=A0A7S3QPS5_DUNTE|mmetsp:Transcript_14910/g.40208  ORF Transcript_14910/g.40208 Transcript_14910/m.40208 type:complete len:534 (-) Transcript_14910:146-1747(-)|eukprot:CAMPEP_0202383028 /NCGR_PEP_ID=MMETSP1127-20130417/46714_1 /ASSEMBLY_ACC=CAM_ASM_000462 /TAXON_ID=3047 /ORGANISM="Dunaliella tertiolecta, Strain CCMP1320" /LENGTH=533 /DNA_ID=CAMNT_0048982391 /DNA_START=154 /DNA_END=1755 /DNA_ORIENTATION=+
MTQTCGGWPLLCDVCAKPRGRKPTAQGAPLYEPFLEVDTASWATRLCVGWLLIPLLALLTGALLVIYEMAYMNQTDNDLRDMFLDQRLVNTANNVQHKHFINADTCCNPDPVVFGESSTGCSNAGIDDTAYASSALVCPPLVMLVCPGDLASASCSNVRGALFEVVGLDPDSGRYSLCTGSGSSSPYTGRVLVGSMQGSTFRLEGSPQARDGTILQLDIDDPLRVDLIAIEEFVSNLVNVEGSSSNAYINPEVRLSRAFSLGGVGASLNLNQIEPARGPVSKGVPNPDWDVFEADEGACPDTSINSQWALEGSVTLSVPALNYSNPLTMLTRLAFLNDEALVAVWRVELLERGSDDTEEDGDMATSQAAEPLDEVVVSILNRVEVEVGLVVPGGPCHAWMMDTGTPASGPYTDYTEVWRGPYSGLESAPVSSRDQLVNIRVLDLARPQPIRLPQYGGVWFLAATALMAIIFGVTLLSFLVFVPSLLLTNARRRGGAPPLLDCQAVVDICMCRFNDDGASCIPSHRWQKEFRGW